MQSIGKRRHLVTWKTPQNNRDADTGELNADEAYTLVARRRASIVGTASTILIKGNKPEGATTYTVEQRYLAGLSFDCLMQWDNRDFKVTGIIDVDQMKQWQTITVVEKGPTIVVV